VFAYILLFLSVLWRENKNLSDDLEAMRETLRLEHNRAEQVMDHAKEELAQARLIRRRADWDLFQALKSVEELTARAEEAEANWTSLWQSFRSLADFLRTQKTIEEPGLSLFPSSPLGFMSL
jgi:hypothetical protein